MLHNDDFLQLPDLPDKWLMILWQLRLRICGLNSAIYCLCSSLITYPNCLVFKLYNLIILNSWYDIPSFFHLTTTNTESARCDHLVWLHGVKQKMERTTIKSQFNKVLRWALFIKQILNIISFFFYIMYKNS